MQEFTEKFDMSFFPKKKAMKHWNEKIWENMPKFDDNFNFFLAVRKKFAMYNRITCRTITARRFIEIKIDCKLAV